jgi:hypothetical protein
MNEGDRVTSRQSRDSRWWQSRDRAPGGNGPSVELHVWAFLTNLSHLFEYSVASRVVSSRDIPRAPRSVTAKVTRLTLHCCHSTGSHCPTLLSLVVYKNV